MKQITIHRVSIVPTLNGAFYGTPECSVGLSDTCAVRSVQAINEEYALITIDHGDSCCCSGPFAPYTAPKK